MKIAGIAGIAVCASAVALAAPARAQDVAALTGGQTRVVEHACGEAGVDCFITTGFDLFMEEFTGRVWPLVVVEWYTDLDAGRKERLLPALAEHLDRGGRLLLVYTNLDEWPELQELVGVRTTGDVTFVHLRNIWPTDPVHPTWWGGGGFITGDEDLWPDNGDFLAPNANGFSLAAWDEPTGPPAMTLTRNGRVMTYGFDLDAFEQTAILFTLAEQLLWLLDCQADIDGDGELTTFDFLAFQDLFAAGDPRADFSFDGRLDFFDFLEFQDQFAVGCP
jgi:hypothetical protein